ncbi:MAG TPA: LuxR C-terminal-related transcriptional regulator [Acidimicrobiales bacterium]|nr:LuxR C-terminal-related transcriptional regulator [Acidimicrobiales bacterium]
MADLTENQIDDGLDGIEQAQAALDRCAWAEALDLALAAGVAEGAREADRLDVVAEASWWLGSLDDCIGAREQAYARYEASGDQVSAGQCAVWLYEHHMIKTRTAIAGAWLRRARRALDTEPDCAAFAGLLLREAEVAHGSGELEQALALTRTALDLGRKLPSPDLEAQALQTIGRVLIDAGQLAEGLGHLDEAMLSAVEGRLGPYTTGKVHCSMISACEQLGDLRRAAEWTEATLRWSETHPLAMWPGICRVHHAALLQLRGDWTAAEREARRACAELDGFHVGNVAAGYTEIGEIRRRLGDLQGAEEAFAQAEAICGQQSPGLALVRLAQNRIDAATAIVTRLLGEQTWSDLACARLLPARVQIAVAAGDLDTADASASELERIADEYKSPALSAAALSARGRLQLAQGNAGDACATLHRALQHWSQLEVPYEVATARLLLGQACRNCGDEDGATQSFKQAADIFDRLGAAIDAQQLRDLTTRSRLPAGLTERECEVLSLVAAGSTNREIAVALHLSERTVARHLSNIFTKIGVTSRTAAATFAYEHDLR